ncbi:RNA-binding protein 47C isoform 5 [Hibiscus syriacus]|uniref:RNA-binding protein 47C isoform 5 n=1 Tax=Hibiscus syriacus TaxID=106335 RepID=A0A6A2YW51_HIBSY|nr:RNA-binding protein 47C isoform 5 [Hibiscus syriacus]
MLCPEEVVHVREVDGVSSKPEGQDIVSIKEIQLKKDEAEWRKRSLVGQIKVMYNIDCVQEMSGIEGTSVKVCQWHGLLVVLIFENMNELAKVWSSRDAFMQPWFDVLEMLEGFDGKILVKTWVVLQDVLLQAWNARFFFQLGSRWGNIPIRSGGRWKVDCFSGPPDQEEELGEEVWSSSKSASRGGFNGVGPPAMGLDVSEPIRSEERPMQLNLDDTTANGLHDVTVVSGCDSQITGPSSITGQVNLVIDSTCSIDSVSNDERLQDVQVEVVKSLDFGREKIFEIPQSTPKVRISSQDGSRFSRLEENAEGGLGKREKVRAVSHVLAQSKARVVFIRGSKMSSENNGVLKRLQGKNFKWKILKIMEIRMLQNSGSDSQAPAQPSQEHNQRQQQPPQSHPQWLSMQYPATAMVMQHQMMQPPHFVAPPPPPQHYTPYHPRHHQFQAQQQQGSNGGGENKIIWVGDLHHWMDENYLHSCFASTGEVNKISHILEKG